MKAYEITYIVKKNGYEMVRTSNVDSKDLKCAKNKLAKKHGVPVSNIDIKEWHVIGYF